MTPRPQVEVRPARLADHAAVQGLMVEAGWPTRSLAGWRWAFLDNPARRHVPPGAPIGWVVAEGERVGGYLGNIHQLYWHDGRPVLAATCTSLYVTEAERAQSVRLMSAFFRQAGSELLFTTTANRRSEPLYRLYRAAPVQDPALRQIRLWVADETAALSEGLKLAGLPHGRLAAALLAPVLKAVRRACGWARVPIRPFDGEVRSGGRELVGPAFDRLWAEARARSGLIADRSAETLRWHLSNPDLKGGHRLFAAHDKGGLAGYAITARHQPGASQVARAYLLDYMVRPGADGAAAAMLRAAVAHAAQNGLAILEAVRFGGPALTPLAALGAHCRTVGQQSHFVLAGGALESCLGSPVRWHLTALDGDFWFGLSDGRRTFEGAQPAADAGRLAQLS